jgi:NAD(P)-dependent dehydrogenase (short-subunit alcohol dehydrogenase family)
MPTWATTLDISVTANHRLADEAAAILRDQALDVSIVLTSSANAVVAKRGSEAYDVSKAALSHLVRELAISLAPITPDDCAHAILFLAGPHARCTTGHLIPIDGGLADAFLR